MGKVQAERHVADATELDPDLDATPVPSARPTSAPSFDVAALAAASFRDDRAPSPLDISIPVRTRRAPREGLGLRAAFLLLHVDGRSSIAQISATADIPLSEAIMCFIELVSLGAVELSGGTSRAVPQSGVQRKDER